LDDGLPSLLDKNNKIQRGVRLDDRSSVGGKAYVRQSVEINLLFAKGVEGVG
jgi:hypothetical protein